MSSFRLVILTAGFISVVMSMFEAVYPSEKHSNQIKLIFSLIFILCAISPIVKGDADLSEIADVMQDTSQSLELSDEKTMECFKNSVERNISSRIKQYLCENEIVCSEIKTSINISGSGSISINEIEIAADNTAQEGEIIALVKEYTGEDIPVKVKERTEYDS